jgi:Ca-activated chloride channel family protein
MIGELLDALSGENAIYGGMHLEYPWVLLLLPLPFLMTWLPAAYEYRAALQAPFYQQLSNINASPGINHAHIRRHLFLWALWFLLVFSAAKPVWVGDPIQLPTRGRDLMIAVDISGSMDTRDMRSAGRWVRRIDAVKSVLSDFIERRKGDRIGLILFGSLPYLQAPLSFDLQAVSALLDEAELGFAGQKTAVGDAIGLGLKRLYERPGDQRILILLTDGSNNSGHIEPLQAARLAAEENIHIYTIGIGADAVPGSFGRRTRNRDLDERSLQRIAQITGGRYYRARNPKALSAIYQTLDELEPIQQADELFKPRADLYYISLAIALLCSMLFATMLVVKQYRSRGAS